MTKRPISTIKKAGSASARPGYKRMSSTTLEGDTNKRGRTGAGNDLFQVDDADEEEGQYDDEEYGASEDEFRGGAGVERIRGGESGDEENVVPLGSTGFTPDGLGVFDGFEGAGNGFALLGGEAVVVVPDGVERKEAAVA